MLRDAEMHRAGINERVGLDGLQLTVARVP
jgi:hypothetical protein